MGDNDLMTGYMMGQNENGCKNGNGIFGGDGLWGLIIILALLGGFGNNGFGGGFGGGGGGMAYPYPMAFGGVATQADLAAGFNNSAVIGKLNDLTLGQCQGFHGVDSAICSLGYNVQAGFNGIQHSIDSCCCQTQRAIDGVNYNLATGLCNIQQSINGSTRDLMENQNNNTRAILDFLTNDKIATLQAENQTLKFAASQSNQNAVLMAAMDANKAEILRRTGSECPQAAYIVQPPTPVRFNQGCGCGCGNGYGYAAA